jgi:hypothetical protein
MRNRNPRRYGLQDAERLKSPALRGFIVKRPVD